MACSGPTPAPGAWLRGDREKLPFLLSSNVAFPQGFSVFDSSACHAHRLRDRMRFSFSHSLPLKGMTTNESQSVHWTSAEVGRIHELTPLYKNWGRRQRDKEKPETSPFRQLPDPSWQAERHSGEERCQPRPPKATGVYATKKYHGRHLFWKDGKLQTESWVSPAEGNRSRDGSAGPRSQPPSNTPARGSPSRETREVSPCVQRGHRASGTPRDK